MDEKVQFLRGLVPDSGAYVNEVSVSFRREKYELRVNRRISTNQTGKRHFGVRITLHFLLSRKRLIQQMYSGVIRVLEMKAGKR